MLLMLMLLLLEWQCCGVTTWTMETRDQCQGQHNQNYFSFTRSKLFQERSSLQWVNVAGCSYDKYFTMKLLFETWTECRNCYESDEKLRYFDHDHKNYLSVISLGQESSTFILHDICDCCMKTQEYSCFMFCRLLRGSTLARIVTPVVTEVKYFLMSGLGWIISCHLVVMMKWSEWDCQQ